MFLQESARRAEAAATAAKTAAETKSIELTRARAEVLTLKQQLETTTQQLEAQQARRQKESELGCTDTVAEGIAARLAAAQVMRREAEDNAAELGRRLAATEKKLQRLQQEREVSGCSPRGQLTVKVTMPAFVCAASTQMSSFFSCYTSVQWSLLCNAQHHDICLVSASIAMPMHICQ